MQNQPDIGILEEFRLEFLNCWQKLPNKAFFFVLLVAWVAIFQFFGNSTLGFIKSPSLLVWMYLAYQPSEMGDDGQGLLVPFVVLGLFWWKRKELVSLQLKEWWPGLLIVGFGLMLHLLGFAVQQVRISIVGLFVGIYGLTGLAWGPSWLRKSFFPFCLFVFAVPLGTLAQSITFPLRLVVCRIVEVISHFLLSIDVVRDGTALKDPSGHYQYEVAAACSGLRSLIATVGFAFVFGMVSFQAWWKRGVILASAVPLALVGNVLRMLTIIIAAEIGGQEWGNKVHEGGPGGVFSLLPYIPVFVGIFAIAHWLRKPAPQKVAMVKPLEARTA
jgi:exosortase